MITYVDSLISVCEEFTDTILVDRHNKSILVNIPKQWFDVLDERINKLNYRLFFKKEVLGGYTCCYLKVDKVDKH